MIDGAIRHLMLFAQTDRADIVRSIGNRLKIEFGKGEFLIGKRQREFRRHAGVEFDHQIFGGAEIVECLLEHDFENRQRAIELVGQTDLVARDWSGCRLCRRRAGFRCAAA